MPRRSFTTDAVKGGFVAAMIVYHSFYVAEMYGLADLELFSGFWWLFPRTIAGGFVAISGWNLAAKKARGAGLGGFARRAATLGLVALAISAVTWPVLGKSFVFFGVIHLLALSSILAYPLLGRPALAIAVGVAAGAAGLALGGMRFSFPWLAWLGLRPAGLYPADYLPLAPWFAFVALGAAARDVVARRRGATLTAAVAHDEARRPAPIRLLAAMGRRSLYVYLIHLPLLYGLGWLASALINR